MIVFESRNTVQLQQPKTAQEENNNKPSLLGLLLLNTVSPTGKKISLYTF